MTSTDAQNQPRDHQPTDRPVCHESPRRLRQIGLSTLLLATACTAVWYSVIRTHNQIRVANERLVVSRPLMRELLLKDRDHLAAIAQEQTMYDEFSWQVFVPGEGYRLKIATTGISPGVHVPVPPEPTPEDTVQLSPGQHRIQLETYQQGDEWLTEVQVDLETVIWLKRPKEWNESHGSTGGSQIDHQVDYPIGSDAVLFRRVFSDPFPPSGGSTLPNRQGNGVQLWIEAPQNANMQAGTP